VTTMAAEPATSMQPKKPEWTLGQRALYALGLLGAVSSVIWYTAKANGRQWEMLIATGGSLALMLMARLDHFASLKLGTVELTMRAERAVAEAYATTAQVKAAALALSRITASQLSRSGMLGGPAPLPDRLRWQRDVEQQLRALGASTEELAEDHEEFERVARRAHVGKIYHGARKAVPARAKELDAAMEAHRPTIPGPSEMRALLKSLEIDDAETEAWVRDYEHFTAAGTIRRDDAWRRE
jgi:hypothetical protein